MMKLLAHPAASWVIVGLGVLATLVFAQRMFSRLRRRPWLFGALLLAAGPSIYVGLAWLGLYADSYLRLARPWGAAVGGLAILFAIVRFANLDDVGRKGRLRSALSDSLSVLAMFSASLAVAGAEFGRPLDRLTVIVAIDRSRSIDLVPNASTRVGRELSVAELDMREEDRIGTVAFGAHAATEDPPRPQSDLPAPQVVEIGRDGTDLGAAIRRALAEVPPDSAARIVLLTDGVATRGDTMGAAAAAIAAEVPIDVVPLEQREVPDVRVVAVRATPRVDAGEAFDIRLVTSSPKETEVQIRVKRDGKPISEAIAKIAQGEDVLRIREKATEAGLHRYDVEITAIDPTLDLAAEDNSGSTFVRVRGEAAALVLEGEPGKGDFIAGALSASSFRVEQGGITAVPADLGTLARFDVVVLSDIRAHEMSPTQHELIASYVRDLGGGLILMGGDRSMGPGGYSKTPIEEVSPVSFDLKQERRRASLAEVIGIDISGSMAATVGGHTKLELANEAAARSAELLGAGDMLGVEHVDTTVMWTVPLAPVTDKQGIDKKIRSVGPGGGGIYVDVTLREAYRALDAQKVNLKHVLLFADGDDAENIPPVKAEIAAAMKRGITTSVVALGQGVHIPDLENASVLGGGRFYLIEDAERLPSVFAQETILAARSAIVEETFRVDVGQTTAVIKGIEFESAPPLLGYVVSIPKDRTTVLLTGPEGDPILANWSAGLGRSAIFTSDLKDRWGGEWTRWPGAAKMIAQTARDVARRGDDRKVRLEADTAGGQMHIRANVIGDDGRAQSFRRLMARVAGPDGFAKEIPLEATGAGAYAATVPLSRPGTYIAVARDEQDGSAVGTTGAVLTAGEELRPTGSDIALLERVSAFTGGKSRDTLAGVFADRGTRRFAYTDATSALTLTAALALLLAVAARRLATPEFIEGWWSKLAAARVRRRKRTSQAPAPASPQTTHDALLNARSRAREGDAPPTNPVVRRPPVAAAPLGSALAAERQNARPPAGPRRPPPRSGGPASRRRSASGPASQGGRQLTAAEILLARRKGKR